MTNLKLTCFIIFRIDENFDGYLKYNNYAEVDAFTAQTTPVAATSAVAAPASAG